MPRRLMELLGVAALSLSPLALEATCGVSLSGWSLTSKVLRTSLAAT